jgi:hypothetical protein
MYTGKNAGATIIDAHSSAVQIIDSSINTGASSNETLGIRLNNAKLSMQRSLLKGSKNAHINTLISAGLSSIEIEESEFQLDAQFGANGIYAFDSSLLLKGNTFHGSHSPDFMNALHLRRCEAQVYTNNVIESGSNNLSAAVLMDSVSSWINNSVMLSKGKHRIVALHIKGRAGSHYLFNNVLHSRGGNNTTAVLDEGKEMTLELHSNGFQGWESLLTTQFNSYHEAAELNHADDDPLGGVYSKNMSLADDAAAVEIDADKRVKLTPTSPYIDAGRDVGTFGGPVTDFDKQKRPLPGSGTSEARYDIGSDEYSLYD